MGIITVDDRLSIPSDVFELRKFREWAHSEDFPEFGKISFIAGRIEVDISPEELTTHNKLKFALGAYIFNLLQRRDLGEALADRAFLVNEDADLATEPDITVCLWESLRSGRVRYVPFTPGSDRLVEVRGTPDLVVEIVSLSSVRKDNVFLRKAYFDAGIPEYWLIDARGHHVDFQLLVRNETDYVTAVVDENGYCYSPTLKTNLMLVREQNPVRGSSYRLLDR